MARLKPLTLSNIEFGNLDERVQDVLGIIARDLAERPDNVKPRTLNIKIQFVPEVFCNARGEKRNMPHQTWAAWPTLPPHLGMDTRCSIDTADGKPVLAALPDPFETNPNQTTLFDVIPVQPKPHED